METPTEPLPDETAFEEVIGEPGDFEVEEVFDQEQAVLSEAAAAPAEAQEVDISELMRIAEEEEEEIVFEAIESAAPEERLEAQKRDFFPAEPAPEPFSETEPLELERPIISGLEGQPPYRRDEIPAETSAADGLEPQSLEALVQETVRDTVSRVLERMLPALIEEVVTRELDKLMAELKNQ
jgi:hypothetical protein